MASRSRIVKIVCNTADEAANLQRALNNMEVRAFLGIVGALLPLSARAKKRVLEYIGDVVDERSPRLRIETDASQDEQSHHVEARRAVHS